MPHETSKINTKSDKPVVDEILTVVGFGKTSEDGSTATRLKKADVLMWDSGNCSEAFGEEFFEDSMLCAAGDGTDRYV